MSYLFDELYGKTEDAPAIEDKILMMGLQAAGKTAIKDVVFFNKSPEDMVDYMATVHYQRQYIDEEKSSLVIDSGGQESYWNEAVTHFRHLVFSNVKLLMWIVDVTRPELYEESERRFSFTIRQFKKENPDGRITVLCHKVDLIPPEKMVMIHQHIQESFSDPRFEVDFENTSIYYPDSLKDLIFTIMEEAGMNTKRFELISNLEQKVEESDEFQSYMIEHKGDPRIQQLMDYLSPKPEALLPTFGKIDLQIDLSDYDIVEIVLIEKSTFSPIVGASSHAIVDSEMSMNYLVALQEFKKKIKGLGDEIASTGMIISSDDSKVHGMIFNLANNFLLITSFSEISEERQKLLFELILRFAQSTEVKEEIVVATLVDEVVEVPVIDQVVEVPVIDEEIVIVDTSIEPELIVETQSEIVEDVTATEEKEPITDEPVPEIPQIAELPETAETAVEDAEVTIEEKLKTPEMVPEEPKIQVPLPRLPEIDKPIEVEESAAEIDSDIIPEFVEKLVIESIPEEVQPVEDSVEIVVEQESVETEGVEIDFTAEDIKNFASFLVKKKEVILEESFSVDDIKSMSDFLFKSNNNNQSHKEETKESTKEEETEEFTKEAQDI